MPCLADRQRQGGQSSGERELGGHTWDRLWRRAEYLRYIERFTSHLRGSVVVEYLRSHRSVSNPSNDCSLSVCERVTRITPTTNIYLTSPSRSLPFGFIYDPVIAALRSSRDHLLEFLIDALATRHVSGLCSVAVVRSWGLCYHPPHCLTATDDERSTADSFFLAWTQGSTPACSAFQAPGSDQKGPKLSSCLFPALPVP
nr:hypothetical protein CFP56_53243 [Quercus suber]